MSPQDEKMKAEIKEARVQLAKIERYIKSLESTQSPNWAIVGDASRLRHELQEITRWTRILTLEVK